MAVVGEAEILIGADSAKFAGDLAMLASGMLPVLASATVGVIGLAGALAGAGAAVGVFGAVFATTFKQTKEQAKVFEDLKARADAFGDAAKIAQANGDTKAMNEALKAQKNELAQLKDQMALLPPEQRKAVQGYMDMKGSWKSFVKDNEPATFGIMAQGFNLIISAVKQLQPLFDVGAKAISRMLTAAQGWVDSGGFKGFIDYLAGQATTALPKFGALFVNLGRILGNVFGQIGAAGGGQGMLDWLVQITDRFANFTASAAFTDFLETTAKNTPLVTGLLGSLAQNIGVMAQALMPLAPLSLAVAQALSSLINAVPPGVITAIVGGFIAFSLAMKAYAVAMLLANAATLVYQGIVAIIPRLIQAWTFVQWALNAALLANPIGLIILAIVALIAIVVLIATKTTWFQTIWKVAWGAIKAAAKAVWDWLGPAATAAWNILKNIVSTVTTWVKAKVAEMKAKLGTDFATIKAVSIAAWNAIRSAATTAWNTIKSVASAAINFIKNPIASLKAAANAAWSSMRSAASSAWNSIKSAASNAFNAVKSAVRSAISTVKSTVSSGISSVVSQFQRIKNAITSMDLSGAGRALINTLTAGIRGAIGGAVDAVKGGLDRIKGMLPGSPIKTGPLKSWNRGGAGERLMDLVAEGIRNRAGALGDAGTMAVGKVASPFEKPATRPGTGTEGSGGGDNYFDVTVSLDDLDKIQTVNDFIEMLKNGRTTGRKTRRSGTVTA